MACDDVACDDVAVTILDESTHSGGVGATISAMVNEQCFDQLDAPVSRHMPSFLTISTGYHRSSERNLWKAQHVLISM